MLIAKELSNFIYIIFFCNSMQNVEQIRIFKVSVSDASIVIDI